MNNRRGFSNEKIRILEEDSQSDEDQRTINITIQREKPRKESANK